MTTEEIDAVIPDMMEQINTFINLKLESNPALIYALCQVAHDRLQTLDETDESKGGIISDLITNFGELNKQNLALYKEMVRYLREVKDTTIH